MLRRKLKSQKERFNSQLSKELLGKKGVKAGYRILDADIVRASTDKEVSLFNELAVPKWKLILFDNGRQIKIDEEVFNPKYGFMEKLIITSSLKTSYSTEILYFDIDEVAHRRYRIKKSQFLLVRPDNYVAVRCSVDGLPKAFDFLKKWFTL